MTHQKIEKLKIGRVRVGNDDKKQTMCECWTDRAESETEERNFLFYCFVILSELQVCSIYLDTHSIGLDNKNQNDLQFEWKVYIYGSGKLGF